MSAFGALPTSPLTVAPPKADAIAFTHETGSVAIMAYVGKRLLATLLVMVDAFGNQPTHFLIGENQIMRFVDADGKLGPGQLHQFSEVSIPEFHRELLPFRKNARSKAAEERHFPPVAEN
ncbi:hypothetical protein RCO27_03450 [Sphingosinicella sp. LHD-64]|uniref:hypothetical protein n=1 Tax=Sphingosinicella sp. LHD-64 TaxID=3072139 RepID=UPI00280F61DF|nr:hypothetical protein [Sphingosinicella sp. LHD-64]MDQ8755278.1 hypothetical protein [Sphingosinicella sp. LHD-64]